MHKSRPISRKDRQERKILLMLTFFSIAVGLWENFRQLWLEDNNFSALEVSTITSIGSFISAATIILVGRYVKPARLKSFMTLVLVVKLIDLFILLGLNASSARALINICTVVDIVTSYIIVTSVYPLITTITKSNQAYSRRKLVEYLFRDIGVLVGGVVLGRQLGGLMVNYNACLLISQVFLVAAIAIMLRLKVQPTAISRPERSSVVKYVLKSRIQVCYMVYSFLAATSFATALGLKMLMLTNYLNFSAGTATNFLLIVGLISDVIGFLALKYFTPKNDYITITLKFGIRLLAYIIAVCANDPFLSMLAITWSIMISTAYEDVSDGYYINLVDNRHQFSYSTLKYVMSYLGEACGLLLCGVMYGLGIQHIFAASALITAVQMAVAYYLISLRRRHRRQRHSASRMRYEERIVES